MLAGVGSNQVANPYVGNGGANGNNLAGELMTQNGLAAMPGQGMGGGRDKDRSGEVFVQVGPANATVRYFDLHFISLGRCRYGNFFYTDVFLGVPYSCFHRLSHFFNPFCGK